MLLDGLTRLGRAYNLTAPSNGRQLAGSVDSSALHPPKRFFGAARNLESGGSLTIIATALVETGSVTDEVIFEEFQSAANMELRLRSDLADERLFPAVDAGRLRHPPRGAARWARRSSQILWKLRRVLSGPGAAAGARAARSAAQEVLDQHRVPAPGAAEDAAPDDSDG